MDSLDTSLLTRSLNFHGQQFQKLWESERGDNDLAKRNVKDLNFQVYSQRQKSLSFQDRTKRLKLQQFIVKNAETIFANDNDTLYGKPFTREENISEETYAVMPPLEMYCNVDKQKRLEYFFENVKIGDLIVGTIVSKTQAGMMLKVLCTTEVGGSVRYVADINVKAFCPVANVIPAIDKKGVTRTYMMNDSVCCEVLEVIPDSDKMVCGMKGTTRGPNDPDHRPALGLINADEFPLVYKKALENKNEPFNSVLEKSIGFNNPNNISYLAEQMNINKHISFMKCLRGKFPENEYATELRQVQASKWAYRNVADGIDHFKAGKHIEAFQCLNKALSIDPKNVEGLVARGALYANSGNFQKAIEDFESALKLNSSHANARKYMGETLVALGRSYEEDNQIDEAKKAYQSCLSLIPFHEEAKNSLEFLKTKSQPKNVIEPTDLLLPNLSVAAKSSEVNDALKHLLNKDEDEKKDKKKKKKTKKRKSRRRSSSSSSSSSSGSESTSSDTSSSSDSSSSSGDSDFKKRKKRHSRSRRKKENSLSPLSKRMAMMGQSNDTPTNYTFNRPSTSFDFAFEQPQETVKTEEMDYGSKLRAIFKETKGDFDYEETVRKFLQDSTKWKKEKDDDDKKKKKKESKKKKKESKKKKKEKKGKRKSFDIDLDDHKFRDVLKKELSRGKKAKKHTSMDEEEYYSQKPVYTKRFLDSLPDFEELESKLNAYYALEKETKGRDLSESPKRSLLDSPSPTREQKARQAVAEATASAGSKWKMQIGPGVPASTRFKKKAEREEWIEEQQLEAKRVKTSSMDYDEAPPKKSARSSSVEKVLSVRKTMAMKEPPLKKPDSPKKTKTVVSTPTVPKPVVNPGQVVLDKFGNFRLMTPPEMKKSGYREPPLPPGAPPGPSKGNSSSGRRPPEPPGRPRSASRSPPRKTRSRSRDKYSRSRSSSESRSRSRSYRSRSRSYYSRSRSRSGSYYSRSRSRSRSYSGDRRHYRRGGFRGRFNDRGTYYKPRFQNPRIRGGRGGYYNRDNRGRGRPYGNNNSYYNNRGMRRQPRGRYPPRGGYRDYRDRRYERSRSRDRSRSYSRSPDSDSGTDAMKKVNSEKDKINKYINNDGSNVKHEGPLSEGEDRDDYTSTGGQGGGNDKLIDREAFDGKWAEKKDDPERSGENGSANIPPETNIEEMDKFLTKVKKDKKEDMLERNKDLLKNKS